MRGFFLNTRFFTSLDFYFLNIQSKMNYNQFTLFAKAPAEQGENKPLHTAHHVSITTIKPNVTRSMILEHFQTLKQDFKMLLNILIHAF